MAMYIDVDKLYELMENRKVKGDCKFCNKYESCIKNGINRKGSHLYCWEQIELPTADVREVKRGYWIAKASTHTSKRGRLIHYDRYKCSECGVWNGRHKQDFCPHCGADMRGDTDEKL